MSKESNEIENIIEETKKIKFPVFSEDKAWDNISSELSEKKRVSLFSRRILKYASIITVGLLIGILVSKVDLIDNNNKYVEIKARKGQKIDITLPDGNKIWINSNSTIKYPANFEEFNKKIIVKGEAYFELPGESFSPILVMVNGTVIQGFDASFNVKARNDSSGVEVTVSKGWVTLNNTVVNMNNFIVEEGSSAFLSNDLPLFVSKTNNQNYLAWKTGKLQFENVPLSTVVKTLSEYYEIPIQIKGSVKYCKFSSSYLNAEIETILNDVKRSFNPKINIDESYVIINGDDC